VRDLLINSRTPHPPCGHPPREREKDTRRPPQLRPSDGDLAVLAVEREDVAEAVRQWWTILEERPGDGEARDQLRRLGTLVPIGSG